jgi:hypothetical protein
MTARVNLQKKKKILWCSSRGLGPKRTDWRQTASRKVTLTLTLALANTLNQGKLLDTLSEQTRKKESAEISK